ncbi:unnamed protein product [Phyllotreta striolata]|uniref:acid phosphatase n=1 Tax=Phyllotreta striolata TaxID=444603 RepID=A0A9N9TZX4_PHYSR|nr:unnamed protein product [Phyllotreta striolata]
MTTSLPSILTASVLLIISVNCIETNNLVALVQIFRHGERTPMKFYPNDPYKNHWADLNTEQLTNKGRRQMYSLGQHTRNRYSSWIPLKYQNKFIRASSTDVDRTLVSGQTFLYGLFPASGDQKWLPTSDWQGIPLHPADPKVLFVSPANCPTYEKSYAKLLAGKEFVKLNESLQGLYEYLTNNTGETIDDLHSAETICDTLGIEEGVGLKLPEWTKKVYPEQLKKVYKYWLKSLTYTKELKRFYVGSLFNEMLEFFDEIATNSTDTKMRVYSGHDDNIASILNSFGALDQLDIPGFGSSLWLELRKNDGNHFVNVWYKNGDNTTQIRIEGCELDCPLKNMKSLLHDIVIDVENWTKECNYDKR